MLRIYIKINDLFWGDLCLSQVLREKKKQAGSATFADMSVASPAVLH